MFSLIFVALGAESGLSLSVTPRKIILELWTVFCPLPLHLQALTENDCRMSENHVVSLDFCQALFNSEIV